MGFLYFIIGSIWAIAWGCIVREVNENRGYDGGFWLGFFLGVIGLIIVISKPPLHHYQFNSITEDIDHSQLLEQRILNTAGWKCNQCGNINASYTTSCACGMTQAKNKDFDHLPNSFRICPNCKKLHPKYVFSCDCGYPDHLPTTEEPTDKLLQLKALRDADAITQEEYEQKKQELLDQI